MYAVVQLFDCSSHTHGQASLDLASLDTNISSASVAQK